MRISDWSSDVCSSDLLVVPAQADVPIGTEGEIDAQDQESGADQQPVPGRAIQEVVREAEHGAGHAVGVYKTPGTDDDAEHHRHREDDINTSPGDRTSDVWGKSVSVRVEIGGCR